MAFRFVRMQQLGMRSVAAAAAVAALGAVLLFPAVARAASAGVGHSCVVLEGGLVKVRFCFWLSDFVVLFSLFFFACSHEKNAKG